MVFTIKLQPLLFFLDFIRVYSKAKLKTGVRMCLPDSHYYSLSAKINSIILLHKQLQHNVQWGLYG